MLINRVSDNAGCVKYFFPTQLHPPGEERQLALVDGFALCSTNQGSLVISFRSDISIRPMHLFGLLSPSARAARLIWRAFFGMPGPRLCRRSPRSVSDTESESHSGRRRKSN